MTLDEFCSSDQWSMLSSASEHSKLAAALGGFLITAIALHFKGETRESVHTMALFSSAVLILVLDSFLFSMLTGTVVPHDGDRHGICAIAWTQGALATAMLAAGATALFGGLSWMLAGHVVNKLSGETDADVRAFAFLANLGGWLTFAAVMTTTLLLSETAVDYLHFMYGDEPETWLVGLITGSAAVVVVLAFGLVYVRTRRLHAALTDAAGPAQLALRSIKVATVVMLALAIVASWLAMTLARFPKDWLTTPNSGIVSFVLVLTFVAPAVIATAICYSVPGPDDRESAISE